MTTESATTANENITVITGSSGAGPATSVAAGMAEVKASSAQAGATLAKDPVPIIPVSICHGSLIRLLLALTGEATVTFLADEAWHLKVTISDLLNREQETRCIWCVVGINRFQNS